MSDVIVTVIGAGAIGTSLGLALKQLEDAPQLMVHDKKPEHSKQAMKMAAFDRAEWNLINACDQADLIVLAIPAAEIRPTLEAIAQDVEQDVIISDTAQTKHNIMKMAEEILPDHAHFVGGNPIVTPADSGPSGAQVDLFKDTIYCLTPSPSVLPDAVKLLEDMVKLIGATPFYLDALEHDGLMSGVTGLPAMLSLALINSVSQTASWKEMRKLAGGLFSSVSAGATGDPDSLAEEFLGNQANVLRWTDGAMASLETMKGLILAGDPEPLAQFIDEAVVTRANWQNDYEKNALSNLDPSRQVEVEKPGLFKQLFGIGRNK